MFAYLTGGTISNTPGGNNTLSNSTAQNDYMGPGTGDYQGTDIDAVGAGQVAVPILIPGGAASATVTGLTVALGDSGTATPGSAGSDPSQAYQFGVCVTHNGTTTCSTASGPGTGLWCQIVGAASNPPSTCSDLSGSLQVFPGDQLMVKAMGVGNPANGLTARWSARIGP